MSDKKMPVSKEDDADVSPEERKLIDESFINDGSSRDNQNLERSMLDNTDEDGVLLDEQSGADDISGDDLDVPGSEDDDDMEDSGGEDEENNGYTRADTD
jgi:hypothetical protein